MTGLGLFDKIAKHAGAGTLVPITGFANAMVAPALEFKSEGMVTGVEAGCFHCRAGAGVSHFGQRGIRTDPVPVPIGWMTTAPGTDWSPGRFAV